MRITGCCTKSLPAVALEEGWVRIPRAAVAPTSIKLPKLVVLLVTAVIAEVPVLEMIPLVRGLAARGRTRMFCQVIELVSEPLLAEETVNVIWLVVREVMAAEVPEARPLISLLSLPPLARSVIKTVGAVPLVSKMKPEGAWGMIVPGPTSPFVA